VLAERRVAREKKKREKGMLFFSLSGCAVVSTGGIVCPYSGR